LIGEVREDERELWAAMQAAIFRSDPQVLFDHVVAARGEHGL
jgi:hypothetical protein